MKDLNFLKFALLALGMSFLFSAGHSQVLQNGTMSPTATPRAQIMDWLAQNRVRAKQVSNTSNIQNWLQGPKIEITGEASVDQGNYQSAKATWINANPNAYSQAHQEQIQYMQSNQNQNARVDKVGERKRITAGNGFILPSQGNTPTGNN